MGQRSILRRAAALAFVAVPVLHAEASLAAKSDATARELVIAQSHSGAKKADPKREAGKKTDAKSEDSKKNGKPVQVGSYGDWGAFVAHGGKEKTCYALAMPKDRMPASLKRDQAYVFISTRPGENVHNEVSIIMGFPLKEGGDAKAEIGGTTFDLVAKGTNAWIKSASEEPRFVEAAKKGSKLVVKAPSVKGHVTTDTYSLSGLAQALERVQKECP